jgi:hypothetical protein
MMMAPPPSSPIISQQPLLQSIPSPNTFIKNLTSVGLFGKNSLHPSVKELYEGFQHVCSTCGLRYHSNEKYANHLDKHFRTASSKSKALVLSRKWFQNEKVKILKFLIFHSRIGWKKLIL